MRDELDQVLNKRKTARCVRKQNCAKCPKNEVAGYGNPMCEKTCDTIKTPCTIMILRAECE